MDDTPINLESILEQAPKWTLAGDFTLLQWMNQISQDLETRATKTTEALDKLNNNVRSTNIALDNVANSLTALQFGNQFVECRVQDDDETIMNTNEASCDVQNQTEHIPSSKEMLNTFLDNNLKVLRNCHEKYSIDLDDSDEDDEGKSKEKTCIYQPINPYNEKPLPFIFGSKDWHAKWHVGLYENQEENSYSGDEISEAFSESSSTSHLDDNESFESNTEWASSFSIDNDNVNTNIEVKNASSLRGSQSLYPGAKSVHINADKNKAAVSESSSISTPSSSLAKKSIHSTKHNEISTQRSGSVNSISSKNSSKATAKETKDNTLQYKTQPQKFVDLFAEPPEDHGSITSSSSSSLRNNIPTQVNKQTVSTERSSSTFRTQPPPFVDLFAEPPEDIPSSTASSISSGQQTKRKTVNLFDDDDQDDVSKDDLLTVLTKKEELVKPKNDEKNNVPPIKATSINNRLNSTRTPKSLFEDSDDEDDDFLKAFVKKSSSKEANKTSLTKTLLFDNEFSEDSSKQKLISVDKENTVKDINNKKQNIFNDTEGNLDDVLVTKNAAPTIIENNKTSAVKENTKKTVNLFDDLDDVSNNLQPKVKPKKINLFDDLDDDGDDIFSIKPKQNSKKLSNNNDILQEKVTKNIENNAEEENNTTEVINIEEPIKNPLANTDNLENEVITTSEVINKSNEIQENILDQNVSTNIEPDIIEYKDAVKNKNPPSNESKDLADAKQIKNDEKITQKDSIDSENFVESSNYDKTTLDKKELNNNETISITQEQTVSISTTETPKINATNKYDFNSVLFLDEPPEDDNEFFETLTKTSQTLNTNYNVIDLENDIYEPELPKVPGASTNNNQTDVTENRQTSLYTGLQLFSDIPPDDDDVGDNNASNRSGDVNQTKRLHSVFYDDFNETLMALNKNQIDKEIPKHSIFSDEPPPINEELNSSSEDAIDHKIPDIKADVTKEDYKLKGSEIASKIEESLSKTENKNDTISKRPVSKLQMPQININVQALLPGANNTIRKVKEDNTKTKVIDKADKEKNDEEKTNINISAEVTGKKETNVLQKQTVEVPRTAETEHILPSVTKNRVRAPASRRPSTRRARQENYRKSLIEEQQTLDSDVLINEIENENKDLFKTMKTNIPKNLLMPEESKSNKGDNEQQYADKPIEVKPTKPLSSILFEEDKSHDDSNIFDENKSVHVNVENLSEMLKEEKTKHMEVSSSEKDKSDVFEQVKSNSETHKKVEIKTKTVERNTSLLFDDEEDDYDLFKHIKTSKTNDNKKATQVNENKTKAFNSHDESNPLNNTKIQITKEIPEAAPPVTTVLSKLDSTQQQPLKTDDNFLNEPHDNATSKINKIETISEITKQSSINKAKSTFLDDDDEDDDDLFKTTIQNPITFNRSRESNSKAKSQFKSFLDSESDDDIKVAGLPTTSSKHIETASSTKTPLVSAPQKNTNTKLFSDSDTDSDDLFGKLSSTKSSNNKILNESSTTTTIQTKPQPKTSLFSDESDDGEDFLKSSSSIVSKNTVSKSVKKENKTKMGSQTNTSLFSDIDSDEDDLFGSGGAKANTKNATNIPAVKVSTTSKPITVPTNEIPKPKTEVTDNPLADLL